MLDYKHHHISINTLKLESAIAFYRLLGFSEVFRFTDESITIVHLLGRSGIVELFNRDDFKSIREVSCNTVDPQYMGLNHFALQVGDIRAAYHELEQFAQCEVTVGRTDISYFFVSDPDGNLIEIVEDFRILVYN